MSERELILLVVEDDYVDTQAVIRGLSKIGAKWDIRTATEGNAALEMLRSTHCDSESKRVIVTLDINMPGMNGHQFLEQVRSDPVLNKTIVFVLTTSDHSRDLALAYERNVAGYFLKSNLEGMFETVSSYARNNVFPPPAGSATAS